MRKATAVFAVVLATGAVGASAEARGCLVVPPNQEGFSPVTYGYRDDPYTWGAYPSNYSNFTPADCGYYDRRFYGARVYIRVRDVYRPYR